MQAHNGRAVDHTTDGRSTKLRPRPAAYLAQVAAPNSDARASIEGAPVKGIADRRFAPSVSRVLSLQRMVGNTVVSGLVHRQTYGPAATGTPASWETDVEKATTAAARCALVKQAVGSAATVVDQTANAQSDAKVDPSHLQPVPTVNYDDNLNQKKKKAQDAGTTTHDGAKSFVVLGPLALRKTQFFWTRVILAHEFDHVNQNTSKSKLKGDDSEVDAWTTSFIRDFHRTYVIKEISGGNCYVDDYLTFSQFAGYYANPKVDATLKTNTISRIKDYYNNTIKPHKVHDRVFRFWVHRTITTKLAEDINNALSLVNPADDVKKSRQFPCDDVKKATFPAPP